MRSFGGSKDENVNHRVETTGVDFLSRKKSTFKGLWSQTAWVPIPILPFTGSVMVGRLSHILCFRFLVGKMIIKREPDV